MSRRSPAWKQHRDEARDKRVSKLLTEMLRKGHHVQRFSEHHYRVNDLIDWWPCTGKWRSKDGSRSGTGSSIYQALENT